MASETQMKLKLESKPIKLKPKEKERGTRKNNIG
jgi:hypothetical protein